ncbi:hypothetical protein N0V83_009438 [Neocucurbitaria cava]|uniref:Uncharacterized protein n=1 Tax=Neocucurbitaria cava TaxID=798079 RepID=A0A9W8Y1F1_9PLEO|nr:hypothetical protein N0V83_009438 [Neocucurbitaria cava]
MSADDSVLARMITTIDDNTNGFRLDLMRMALSSSDASAQSLLQATLALSSFHLGRAEEALKHKVRAIKSLSESVRTESASKPTQLAACLMLCVYSVFDATDTTWNVHLQGAKTISGALTKQEQEMSCFEFISPWYNYHDTLSGYSLPAHLPGKKHRAPRIILPESDSENRKEIHIVVGESTGTLDHQRITLTAEFYRVATLLYLYQIAPDIAIPEQAVQNLVRNGFKLMDQMNPCTSPWPLFIIACNVTSDSERLKILTVLNAMIQKRRIGNYRIIKGLIQTLWKQQDLTADEVIPKKIDWRNLIDPDSCTPSFI